MLERALPHVHDPVERSRLLCRMGRVLWTDGKTAAAETVLAEGIPGLVAADEVEAAGYRLILARAQWEQSRPDSGTRGVRRGATRARGRRAPRQSSRWRTCGSRVSTSSSSLLSAASRLRRRRSKWRRPPAPTSSGSGRSHGWPISLIDVGRTAEGIEDARRVLRRGAQPRLLLHRAQHRVQRCLDTPAHDDAGYRRPHPRDRVRARAGGHHQHARDCNELGPQSARRSRRSTRDHRARRVDLYPYRRSEKVRWRRRLELAEVLLELGRFDDAAARIPPLSERAELQDIVYDAAPQIRLRLATGRVAEAIEIAREIAQNADALCAVLGCCRGRCRGIRRRRAARRG